MDGYCLEAFGGSISGAEFLRARKSGRPPTIQMVGDVVWNSKVSVLMDAAQNGLAVVPFIAMAGRELYEHADQPTRDHFELWAYASYLMAVERKRGTCSTVFGISPFYWEGKQRKAMLHPRYTWDLGDPMESHSPSQLEEYKHVNHQTYVRKFQKGIVLVNPSTTKDRGVPLGSEYTDPETGQKMTTANLEPQTGKILMLPDNH